MLSPRNLAQRKYIELLTSRIPVIIGTGPAGTGKTLLACNAASKALVSGRVDRLILTRPAVSVDEQHGYLPGNLEQKMDPWTRPLFDSLYRSLSVKKVQEMMRNQQIEICPLAYMRGRTFDNAWIIGDEMQNSTPGQMKMLLTRIGDDSKMVVLGDMAQHERGFEDNGLKDLVERLDGGYQVDISRVNFSDDDVVRSEVIKQILKLY
jgi:phosphate starvation-inducible PhoH-like protein